MYWMLCTFGKRPYTPQAFGSVKKNIFPSCDGLGIKVPVVPMHYMEALHHLRCFVGLPWKSTPLAVDAPQSRSYTVHGLKSSLISWATQLEICEEYRCLQGKRKATQSITCLYGRDDVFGALQVQKQVRTHVLSGWRPMSPLARLGRDKAQLQNLHLRLTSFAKMIRVQNI